MIVSGVVMVEREPYSKLAGHIVCKFVIGWTDSVIPGVAALQDFLKGNW